MNGILRVALSVVAAASLLVAAPASGWLLAYYSGTGATAPGELVVFALLLLPPSILFGRRVLARPSAIPEELGTGVEEPQQRRAA